MNKNYLREQLKKYPGFYGRNGKFYQSLDGVVSEDEARRPTTERLTKYGVLDVINKDTDILDIGCNAGFISLTAAKKAKSVLGLESEPELTNIANGAKSIVNHGHEETDEKQKMDRKFYLLKRKRKPNGM